MPYTRVKTAGKVASGESFWYIDGERVIMCYKVGDLYRRSDIYDLLTGRFMPVDQIGAGLHYVTPDTAVVPRKLVEERVQRDHQQRLVDESRNR